MSAQRVVIGFQGLGDNFYQRPVIKSLVERDGGCYLQTPWPWVYHDLSGVKFIRPTTSLRTQKMFYESLPSSMWTTPPPGLKRVSISYHPNDFRSGRTPTQAFAKGLGLTLRPAPFEIPEDWEPSRVLMELDGRPFGLVKPPTVRKEWKCPSRNPKPGLIQEVLDRRRDLVWISVGWLKDSEEWLDGPPLTGTAYQFNHGELGIREIVHLVATAEFSVSGPCFLLPMSMALGMGERSLCIFGGHTPPENLVDDLLGSESRVLAPDPFCACHKNGHGCSRDISIKRLHKILEEMR